MVAPTMILKCFSKLRIIKQARSQEILRAGEISCGEI